MQPTYKTNGRAPDEAIEMRLPPHNPEAEAAVLGSLLIDPDALYEVEPFLKPAHFYRTANRWVYEAILKLRADGRPLDIVTLIDELSRREQLEEIGGETAVIDLLNAVPTSINVETYGRMVYETGVRRGFMDAAGRVAKLAWDETLPIAAVIGGAEQAIFRASADVTGDGVTSAETAFGDLLDVTLERRAAGAPPVGIPSGLVDVDRITGGFKKTDLYMIAGRPGMGKSSFMTSIVAHICGKLGKRAAVFTLEMAVEQQVRRLIVHDTGLDYGAIERGQLTDDEWRLFAEAAGRWASAPLWIDATAGITPSQLLAKSRRLYAEHGLDIIFVDYLGLMGDDERAWNENNRITNLCAGLKRLAKELDIPVVALAQLSRAVEQRQDKRPQLSDLRDSGSLEQDASAVIFLYRDEYYNPDTTDAPAQAEANVAKHRNGPTGLATLFFQAPRMAFRNLSTREVKL